MWSEFNETLILVVWIDKNGIKQYKWYIWFNINIRLCLPHLKPQIKKNVMLFDTMRLSTVLLVWTTENGIK